ncbi:MAG: hypothetical protein K9J13_15050 [Saprospiraceae bacterium]|nr:hypothetical protein [Saprospiraceae bacterium]
MKTRITKLDYIKANRKASREAEIDEHKHVIPRHKVHRSKKIYDRKNYKAGRNDLPFFIIGILGKFNLA